MVKRVVLRGQVVFVADHPDDKTTIAKVICAPGYGQSVAPLALASSVVSSGTTSLQAPRQSLSVRNQWKDQQQFTSVDVLTKDMLRQLFHIADEFDTNKRSDKLLGKRLALLFFEASTRTRVSFEAAMRNLGKKLMRSCFCFNRRQVVTRFTFLLPNHPFKREKH